MKPAGWENFEKERMSLINWASVVDLNKQIEGTWSTVISKEEKLKMERDSTRIGEWQRTNLLLKVAKNNEKQEWNTFSP